MRTRTTIAAVRRRVARDHRRSGFQPPRRPIHHEVPASGRHRLLRVHELRAGREEFVTLIANYVPVQAAYGGPNYFPSRQSGVVRNPHRYRRGRTREPHVSVPLLRRSAAGLDTSDPTSAAPLSPLCSATSERLRRATRRVSITAKATRSMSSWATGAATRVPQSPMRQRGRDAPAQAVRLCGHEELWRARSIWHVRGVLRLRHQRAGL